MRRKITLQLPEPMLELAKLAGVSPETILVSFMQDLLRLPGSNGSDERTMAGEYFLRAIGNCVSYETWETLGYFLEIDRR